MHLEALERAIKIAGGQSALARKLGPPIRQGQIRNWLYRDKKISSKWIIPIEKAVNEQVTRHELAPDIYPKEQ